MTRLSVLTALVAPVAVDFDSPGFALVVVAALLWVGAFAVGVLAPLVALRTANRTVNETVAQALSTIAMTIALLFLLVIAVSSALAGSVAGVVIVLVAGAVVGTALFVFSRFTVEVGDDVLRASFGWGWPRRTLPFADAVSVRQVRNRWWYGFGIRWFPGGTLWNVWGLDAVEFDLASGGKLRIGTDQPEELLAALGGRVPAA